MHPISVSLVSLGSLKYPVDISYLERWKSQFVSIQHGASVGHLPNAAGPNWQYTNDQLSIVIQGDDDASFTLALITQQSPI